MAAGGHFEQIGNRRTFVPPFVNERFDGPPFWACTFTALLNGANVGWLGQKPATHAEVAALAGASGDSDTHTGSRSKHMIQALRVRYKAKLRLEHCSEAEARRRLGDGWALVAGVTYGELPARYRRWSPRFKAGHRVTFIGMSGDRTRLLDPLAVKGPDYAGEWIAWSDVRKAWWPAEQLWFHEGQFVNAGAKPAKAPAKPATIRVIRRFDPPHHFRVAANTTVLAFAPGNPPKPAKRATFPHASGANFDAIVAFDPAVTLEDRARTYLQVANGAFAGQYIPLATAGVSADIGADPPASVTAPVVVTTPVVVTAPVVAPGGDAIAAAILDARRAEWERIGQATAGLVVLPPRP